LQREGVWAFVANGQRHASPLTSTSNRYELPLPLLRFALPVSLQRFHDAVESPREAMGQGTIFRGHIEILRTKMASFARFSAQGGNDLPVSPHSQKIRNKSLKQPLPDPLIAAKAEMRRGTIVGHGENYATAFLYATDAFWEHVEAIRAKGRIPAKEKETLFSDAFRQVLWKSGFPEFIQYVWQQSDLGHEPVMARFLACTGCHAEISEDLKKCPTCGTSMRKIRRLRRKEDAEATKKSLGNKTPTIVTTGDNNSQKQLEDMRARFIDVFFNAVRDRSLPKKKEARARFLGESFGADGTVSARRSRDICVEERARIRQASLMIAEHMHEKKGPTLAERPARHGFP
jgi:hypothetical protein